MRCGVDSASRPLRKTAAWPTGLLGSIWRRPHRPRGIEAVARIDPDDDQAIIGAGTQPGLGETRRGEFQDRSAQRAAGVVGENHHGGHAADGIPDRRGASVLIVEMTSASGSAACGGGDG